MSFDDDLDEAHERKFCLSIYRRNPIDDRLSWPTNDIRMRIPEEKGSDLKLTLMSTTTKCNDYSTRIVNTLREDAYTRQSIHASS